jgi:hypothetical protein
MQAILSCFHQAATVFLFSCSSILSATPPARWNNSVLNSELCPRDQLWDPPPALTWEVSMSPPLLFSVFMPLLISAGSWRLGVGSSSGRLACHSAPYLSLCCFMSTHVRSLRVRCWEIGSLLYPCSPGQVQHSNPTSTVCVTLQSTV